MMVQQKKRKLTPLSAAVKRLRARSGDSLERFSRRAELSINSIHRFETGQREPRDPGTLLKLAVIAEHLGAAEEMELFNRAYEEAAQKISEDDWVIRDAVRRRDMAKLGPLTATELPTHSVEEWCSMIAIRGVHRYWNANFSQFPKVLEIVKRGLRELTHSFYVDPRGAERFIEKSLGEAARHEGIQQ